MAGRDRRRSTSSDPVPATQNRRAGRRDESGCWSSRTSRSPPGRTRRTWSGSRVRRRRASRTPGSRPSGRSARGGIDLVLLDLHLPDGSGLDLFRRDPRGRIDGGRDGRVLGTGRGRRAVGRGTGRRAVRDQAVRLRRAAGPAARLPGVPQAGRRRIGRRPGAVDRALGMLRSPVSAGPAQGHDEGNPRRSWSARCASSGRRPATQIGDFLGVSRITARRYLEHLADTGTSPSAACATGRSAGPRPATACGAPTECRKRLDRSRVAGSAPRPITPRPPRTPAS